MSDEIKPLGGKTLHREEENNHDNGMQKLACSVPPDQLNFCKLSSLKLPSHSSILLDISCRIITDLGWFIFIGMVSFLVLITLGGIIFMCWKICSCSCLRCPKNLCKIDVSQICGDYYYSNGERRAGEMEVAFKSIAKHKNHGFHKMIVFTKS